ncbi:MAG: peptide chain release factor 2 [Verrucomicrobia bacterium]|nr:peptide chain release factor 2 [Verrucomicrobiota bacterium]MBU4291532.1 peptide chain release factor 2 [Verrucomicrobiota bacterium]MBU4429101.1 peptide chain release factor 2 [Verrucomicrobiota bacterium]
MISKNESSVSKSMSWRCGGIFDVASREKVLAELEVRMAAADFWNNQTAARGIIDQANAQRAVLNPFKVLQSGLDDNRTLLELAESEPDEAQRQSTWDMIAQDLGRLETAFRKLEIESLFDGRLDRHNAFLSLHAGAGGTEACDWTEMLYRMYRRYCEEHGFEVSLLDILPGEEAGLKNVTFAVTGDCAYGYLSAERGVHRLVRISPFDTNKRRHTSFASLDVVAELDDDAEVEIKDDDLRVDTYRSGGAGGQHVNKTDSAVRLTHLPTGIVVACQTERSQHANRTRALKLLRARLYEWTQDQKRREMEKFYGEKGEIAWGRQIRSYVLQPYTMAKDHRTDVEIGNVMGVLEGHLDPFIEAYLKFKRSSATVESKPSSGILE